MRKRIVHQRIPRGVILVAVLHRAIKLIIFILIFILIFTIQNHSHQMEHYLNHQTNNHWRGIVVLNEVQNGTFDEIMVSMRYLRSKYGT